MASPEGALVDILKGTFFSPPGSAVTAITTRIYWDELPKPTAAQVDLLPDFPYPCIRLQLISNALGEHADLGGAMDYQKPRFQIDCLALSRAKAVELWEAVLATVTAAHGVFDDIRVDPCEPEFAGGDSEPGVGPRGSTVYRQHLDVFVPFAKLAAA